MRKLLVFILLLLGTGSAVAQKYPERREIRRGNHTYNKGEYPEAEISYRRALELDSSSYEATFNLSNTLYKQERYKEAVQAAKKLTPPDSLQAAGVFYNTGNALFQQRKFEEAIQSYKQSLRLNPADKDAKFNLAYAQKMLENQQNKDQDKDQQKDDQNKDPNQDQNKDQKQDQKQDPKDPKQDPGEKPQQPQPTQGGMNPQEAERMLEAMQSNEENTKKKVDAQQVKTVAPSNKNW